VLVTGCLVVALAVGCTGAVRAPLADPGAGDGPVVAPAPAPQTAPPTVAGPEAARGPRAAPPAAPPPRQPSRSTGLPWNGRLANGAQVPSSGPHHVTWDPVLRAHPNRAWRRWGNDRAVDTLMRVAGRYARAHPDRPRLVIGDLSRPRGGDFGPRFGLPGHASHQSGLDIDLYYPRRDGRLAPPDTPVQVDRAPSQWLVDAFVAEGAVLVFTGPSLDLRGPTSVVQPLVHHDNHLHIRFAPGSLPRGGR